MGTPPDPNNPVDNTINPDLPREGTTIDHVNAGDWPIEVIRDSQDEAVIEAKWGGVVSTPAPLGQDEVDEPAIQAVLIIACLMGKLATLTGGDQGHRSVIEAEVHAHLDAIDAAVADLRTKALSTIASDPHGHGFNSPAARTAARDHLVALLRHQAAMERAKPQRRGREPASAFRAALLDRLAINTAKLPEDHPALLRLASLREEDRLIVGSAARVVLDQVGAPGWVFSDGVLVDLVEALAADAALGTH